MKTHFKTQKVFPGAKSFPRHFDAVVIYYEDPKEINFMKDIITKYQDAPIKIFLGNDKYADAKNYKAESFTLAEKDQSAAYIKNQHTQVDEMIQKVFKQFDKDNSGYIDVNELNDIAKELGKPLDQAEVEESLKDLDISKDNKISLDEFRAWWLSGRQSASKWIRRLLNFKLKTSKFVDAVGGNLKEVVDEASQEDQNISTNHLSININKVQNPGTTINAKLLIVAPELKEAYDRIRQMHPLKSQGGEDSNQIILTLTADLKDISVAEFISKLDETVKSADIDKELLNRVSYVADGDKLSLAFDVPVSPLDFGEHDATFKII